MKMSRKLRVHRNPVQENHAIPNLEVLHAVSQLLSPKNNRQETGNLASKTRGLNFLNSGAQFLTSVASHTPMKSPLASGYS
jgi:hypothetical protein